MLDDAPSRRGVWRLLRRLVGGHRTVLSGGLLATTAASLAAIVATVLVGRMTDAVLRGDRDPAITLALAGVALSVAQVVTTGYGQAWLSRAGEYVVRDLRDTIAVRLLSAPLRFVERHRTGDLVQRGTAEVAALSTFVRDSFPQLVTTLTTVVAAVVVLAVESWQLLLAVLLGFLPAAGLLMRRFRRAAGPAFAAEAAAEADVMAGLAEIVRTRSLLRQASGIGRRRFFDDLDDRGATALRAQMRTVVASRWVNAMALVEGLSLAALLLVGVVLVDSDTLTVGVVVTFVLAGRTLFTSFSDLSGLLGDAEEAATGLARAQDLLDLTGPPVVPVGSPVDRRLVASGVSFGYGDHRVLDGVDLEVEPGDRVCLVGRTGAGKSTFAKLLAGLYRPDAGSVRLGGVVLADLVPAERAAWVAYVPQQVQLGPGTLRDELRVVAPDASDTELVSAFGTLGLAAWLDGLPAGLGTTVTGALSAGERQLVGLVRVTLTAAAVLVLDEATSDLDAATAALVEGALDRLAADRAVVVVAHRAETIASAGRVVELDDGRQVLTPS